MKLRGYLALAAVIVAVSLFSFLSSRRQQEQPAQRSSEVAPALTTDVAGNAPAPVIASAAVNGVNEPLLGETILSGYGNTNLPPKNDLVLMSRLMENSRLLLKSAAHRPLSANEDWADLLRGRNAAAERFLPDGHPAVNAQGQLVDRWRTPLFFHALGGGRYELRSAGPDKKLWTNDDLHRGADGRFHRGEQLNPASLMKAP